jgi:hypothetical protein
VLVTTDEWEVLGIDLSQAATSIGVTTESEGIATLFEQAAYRFQRANCSALRSIAMLW